MFALFGVINLAAGLYGRQDIEKKKKGASESGGKQYDFLAEIVK